MASLCPIMWVDRRDGGDEPAHLALGGMMVHMEELRKGRSFYHKGGSKLGMFSARERWKKIALEKRQQRERKARGQWVMVA